MAEAFRNILVALMISIPLAAAAKQFELNDAQEARYQHLIEELRCLVCQNQNIAESNAPLAEDLRGQVAEMIIAGRSDAEIKDYLVQRYGDFVLYRPPFKPITWLLWSGPFLLLLLALFIAFRLYKKPQQETGETLDREQLQALLEEKPDENREQGS